MADIQRITELRSPPVIGRKYLVPFVDEFWSGRQAHWPVLGPKHDDIEHFNFRYPHFHVDARFVTMAMLRGTSIGKSAKELIKASQTYPLCGENKFNDAGHFVPHPIVPKGRPNEAVFRCVRSALPYGFSHTPAVTNMRAAFGDCQAIALRDGRKLCPHRKVDLSTIAPDPDGLVTCPLHGLRVRVAA